MGYYTKLSGGFTINPGLTHKDLKDVPADLKGRGNRLVWLECGTEVVDTPDGKLYRDYCQDVLVYDDDEVKAYDLDGEVAEIAKAFPNHTFVGYIQGEGEENDDLWRIHIRNGKAIKINAELTWPDLPEEE